MKITDWKWTFACLLLVAAALSGCIWRQSVRRYEAYFPHEPVPADATGVRATFLGVSTIYFTDGHSSILIDGFLTRPAALREDTVALAQVEPDPPTIARVLRKAGISKVDAIPVVHSHFDHALDTPEVAKQTGAVVLGSKTTYWICQGWGLPDEQFREMGHRDTARFGNFEVTFIRSRHVPFTRGKAILTGGESVDEPDELTEPLVPPVHWGAYPEGGSYDIYLTHPLGKVLVHASAGYIEGALDGSPSDVIFLGIARLGDLLPSYRRDYLRETVGATGAKLVVPVHWDDYSVSLDEPLRPVRRLVSDLHDGMEAVIEHAEANPGVEVRMMDGYDTILLFPGEVPAPPESASEPGS